MMEQTLEQQAATSKQSAEETPLEAFASICGVLVLGLFALTFIFQNFAIPSSSMEKTLLVGDHVMVDRVTLAPRRVGLHLCITAMCGAATLSSSSSRVSRTFTW